MTARHSSFMLAAALGAIAPVGSAAAQAPDEITIDGTLRDFSRNHVDFGVVPSHGYGHYAGLIGLTLDTNGRPSLGGSGFKVGSQFRDRLAQPIAPHLLGATGSLWENAGAASDGPISIAVGAMVDSWDSSLGSYAATQSADAVVVTSGDLTDVEMAALAAQIGGDLYELVTPHMPALAEPTGMPATSGKYKKMNGTHVISADLHCTDFQLSGTAEVLVSGDVRILVEGNVDIKHDAVLDLMPGATLEMYTKGSFMLHQGGSLNTSAADPGRVTLYHLSGMPWQLHQSGDVYAQAVVPLATADFKQGSQFYGRVMTSHLDLDQTSGLHLDQAGTEVATVCSTLVEDVAGSSLGASAGSITSADTFAEWYDDVVSVNMSITHAITLVRDGFGVYEFQSDAFHPLDDRLLGNEGEAHNNYFTLEIEAPFTFAECSDQFLEFAGCDDAWIFVDGALAIDLGGVQGSAPESYQHVDFDRLGLVDGERYMLRLFFAQRNPTASVFRLRTNVELQPAERIFTMFAPFD